MTTSVWEEFGFADNPYSTAPVPSSADGMQLLVGRDEEVAKLLRRVTSTSGIPTVEGANGVGKTSIVSVASYRLATEGPGVFLALPRSLQLSATDSLASFVRDAYLAVAQTLVSNADVLEVRGIKKSEVAKMSRWLAGGGSAQTGFGASAFGFGGNFQHGTTTGDTSGFVASGFRQQIDAWLGQCFPRSEEGGVICLLDNLEVVRTSTAARDAVEELRDDLLSQPGLRWILCGTRDVVRGAISSSRMHGRVSEPIVVSPVDPAVAPEVVARRIELFGSQTAYVPVDANGFRHLYAVLGRHLRESLKYCQEFALFLVDQNHRPATDAEKQALLEQWLAQLADSYTNVPNSVSPRAWQLFDDLSEYGGEATAQDHDIFDFRSSEEMLANLEPLEAAQLVTIAGQSQDGADFHVQLGAPGWLVRYQRRNYVAP